MKIRHGKIARLPRPVQEQLNERLERAEPGPKLLAWLNALPEVREVLRTAFSGSPITKQNLSQWRRGGFQESLACRYIQRQSPGRVALLLAKGIAALNSQSKYPGRTVKAAENTENRTTNSKSMSCEKRPLHGQSK